MKLLIDNLDGHGPRDYTSAIDLVNGPRIVRPHNRPAELRLSLVAHGPDFVVPASGARITLGRANGSDVFTGYLAAEPTFEYFGWGERGPVYRYDLIAISDEFLLDRKTGPSRPPFVGRSAGDALRQLTRDLLPGAFDTTAVEDLETLSYYACSPQKGWSEHAAEIAQRARATYRVLDGKVFLIGVGSAIHVIDEADPHFCPASFKVTRKDALANDVLLMGRVEPQARVKDYFVGDGFTSVYYLSQQPIASSARTIVDEEYKGTSLDATLWQLDDATGAVSVNGGKLSVNGGGLDGQTTLRFREQMELGGAYQLQHGDLVFTAPSSGMIGGLYDGPISEYSCLAGFRLRPSGSATSIQAFVNRAPVGTPVLTVSSHRYVLTTRFYASEAYRTRQTFHSSAHPAGQGRGGESVLASVRFVLELHDIDPGNPRSTTAASTVLFDGIVAGTPGFCTYAPVNAAGLHCDLAFTRIVRAVDAEVQSALPGEDYRTRLVGPLSDGAECRISSQMVLQFYPDYVPAPNEQVVVRYRGSGRAAARVTDPANINALQRGLDDGVRGLLRAVQSPSPRTSADCENAALALLDDLTRPGWVGEYRTWNAFLPAGTADVFPGDAVRINVPSRGASFDAIVREVEIQVADLKTGNSRYHLRFADEAAQPLAFSFDSAGARGSPNLAPVPISEVGTAFIADLFAAEVTAISSTAVTIDAGSPPPPAGRIEVRSSDYGWGQENDRNLIGRFSLQVFSVPRLGRTQTYYLRQYDGASPARYSRYSTALHIDYPL
jgi:hypothetical protein